MSEFDNISDTRFDFFRLSNFDRDASSVSASNFTVNLGSNTNIQKCKNMWVHMVSLPNVFYNVYSGVNDLVVAYNDGSDHIVVVTVPPGQYTTTQLMAELKTLIDAVITPGTVTFTQDPITSLISYTTTGVVSIVFFPYPEDDRSTLAPLIGNTILQPTDTSGTFANAPALQGEKMVYLHSRDILPSQTLLSFNNGTLTSCFCSIPVKVNYRDQIIYESRGSLIDRCVFSREKPLNRINIVLRSQDGRVLEVGDNQEIVVCLKIFY